MAKGQLRHILMQAPLPPASRGDISFKYQYSFSSVWARYIEIFQSSHWQTDESTDTFSTNLLVSHFIKLTMFFFLLFSIAKPISQFLFSHLPKETTPISKFDQHGLNWISFLVDFYISFLFFLLFFFLNWIWHGSCFIISLVEFSIIFVFSYLLVWLCRCTICVPSEDHKVAFSPPPTPLCWFYTADS